MALTLRLAKLSLLSALLFSISTAARSGEEDYSEIISPTKLGLKATEKLTHLHFYIHENVTTVAKVAEAAGITNKSATSFGAVNVADDPIRVGPESSSKQIGVAQGIGASASQEDLVIFLALTFAFTEGKFNGSSLTMLGRNPTMHREREMPVLGGTGMFSFCRGYVKTATYLADWKLGGRVIAKYDVYVFHF